MVNSLRLRSFSNFFLGTILSTLLGIVALHLINKRLEPYELGVFSYSYNLFMLIYPLVSLSIYTAYIRFINDYPEKELIRFVSNISLLGVGIMSILIYLISDREVLLLFSMVILLQERLYLLKSLNKVSIYNVVNIVQKSILVSFLYYTESLDSDIVILYYSLSFIFAWSLSLLFRRKEGKNEETKFIFPLVEKKKILKYSFLSSVMTGITWISSFSDQYVIKYYFGFEDLAPYAIAFRLVSVISVATGVFLSYFPVIYFEDAKKKIYFSIKRYRNGFLLSLIITYILCVVLYEYIYIALGADNYIGESRYFFILLIGEILRVSASTYMIYFTYQLKQGFILKSMIVVSTFNLVLNFILVPKYGAISAAYATVISYSLYFTLSLRCYFLEKKYFSVTQEA
ncbi:hypothetical protein BCU71_19385 [Vibrio lentus]|uniref:oligosaccharide flippase family protein n=1 Tax=Vibrio lentus TaxID=136468 RepID=UPI000C82B335|nr:polysaccharide biosynthesis C-terminal domain-containing protein [Vibrio lentus]PMH28904.1 hypothetical protein BCU71_19385 [Vibrio lentus]PMK68433.1 hypothetical protein BCT93_18345 [Vibrio lentus]